VTGAERSVSGAENGTERNETGRKSGEREGSGERTFHNTLERGAGRHGAGVERIADVTKIGLSAERQIDTAHAPLTCSGRNQLQRQNLVNRL